MLLIGAALFLRSVRDAAQIDLGFDPRGVVAMDIDASRGRSNAESLRLFETCCSAWRNNGAADMAAASTRAPLDSSTPIVRVNAHGRGRRTPTTARRRPASWSSARGSSRW